MPETYRVTLSDGRVFDVTTDGGPPSEAEVLAQAGAAEPRASGLEALPWQARTPIELGIGAAKGLGSTVTNLGRLALDAPVVGRMLQGLNERLFGLSPEQQEAAFGQAREAVTPSNAAQRLGQMAEQVGEYFIPAGAGARAVNTVARVAPKLARPANILTQGAIGGGVTAAQGGNPTAGAVVGAGLAAAAPLARGARGGVRAVARRLGRAGAKPALTEMKQIPGASVTGVEREANRIVEFILEHRLTTPEKAEKLIAEAEQELRAVIAANPKVMTDAPQRAARYLGALQRSAAKQGMPAADARMLQRKAAELLQGPHGEDVVQMVGGQPVMSRQLRYDMPAQETLETARASARWQNRKAWGEQKGAAKEASKASERADRDALKAALPETKPILHREAMGIRSKKVLQRQAWRESNRDVLALPATVAGAAEVASGRKPLIGLASQILRDNQLRLGVYANDLARAIQRRDEAAITAILTRIGVPMTSLATQP